MILLYPSPDCGLQIGVPPNENYNPLPQLTAVAMDCKMLGSQLSSVLIEIPSLKMYIFMLAR